MNVYARNLYENISRLPDFNVQLFKPKDLSMPWVGKYLTLWLYYPLMARRQKADINHLLDHSLAHLMRSLDCKRTIITCHDLMGLEVPKSVPGWKRNIFWENITRNMFKARKIITDSQCTKNGILKYTSFKSEDIVVIFPGISTKFRLLDKDKVKQRFNFNKPAVLHVGHDNFYKNVEGLIKAIALLGKGVKLVKVGPISKRQFKLLKNLDIDFIQFMHLSEEELIKVYNAADILVYPSWHEGFGFPVLEAMACGCPVICSDRGSLPEIASGASIMVSPDDISTMAEAIKKVLGNQQLRQELTEKGREQIKKFSWENTVKQTADIYNEIAQ